MTAQVIADAIKARTAQIEHQISVTTSEYDKEKLQERLAKLSGGVAVIKVGAATETEMKEKKLRIEDALNATRAAVAEGIVPGGGTAYVIAAKAADKLVSTLEGDEKTGAALIAKALKAPIMPDRRERRSGRRRYPEQRLQQHRLQLRLRRCKRQVRRHDRARHCRPDQGLPQRS